MNTSRGPRVAVAPAAAGASPADATPMPGTWDVPAGTTATATARPTTASAADDAAASRTGRRTRPSRARTPAIPWRRNGTSTYRYESDRRQHRQRQAEDHEREPSEAGRPRRAA